MVRGDECGITSEAIEFYQKAFGAVELSRMPGSPTESPFGHQWSVGTHVRDVSPEEMQKAMEQMGSLTPD